MGLYEIIVGIVSLVSALLTGQAAQSHGNSGTSLHDEIVLKNTSTITIKITIGATNCRHGSFYLTSPDPVFPPAKTTAGKSHITNWDLLIADYGSGQHSVQLGPYTSGTRFSFGFLTDCGHQFSIDNGSSHFRLVEKSGNFWRFGVEDSSEPDHDYDDISMEITATPAQQSVSAEIRAIQAFNPNPIYIYPWPTGKSYKQTAGPGQNEHVGRAFDYGMPEGSVVTASEKGLVLWVEDSFGVGGCSISYLAKTNVVVIQTETGVNVNYLHLLKGSVSEAGVAVGEIIEKGQVIGKAGRSGTVCPLNGGTGSHLHVEFVQNCYDSKRSGELRQKYSVGKPTLRWNCPNFSSDAAYSFR